MKVTLYTTLGCHLCEQAAALLHQLSSEMALTVVAVDIADDDQLVEQYGIRIPVVTQPNSEEELGWPFDLPTLKRFLDQ